MAGSDAFFAKIEKVIKREHSYELEAYRFVMDALQFTVAQLDKQRHVTGHELLEGIRQFALRQFGPLARNVLNYWGVGKTEDFGQIVFDLVDAGILRKQPDDKLEDFREAYDFHTAFDRNYEFKEDNECT